MDYFYSDGLYSVYEYDFYVVAYNYYDESKIVLRKYNYQWYYKYFYYFYGFCYFGLDLKEIGIVNIVWMVIMGDGIYNFSDGLVIGKWI